MGMQKLSVEQVAILTILYDLEFKATLLDEKTLEEETNRDRFAEKEPNMDFEKKEIFEGCMPVEVMAKRGIDTLRYGPLKPVGFDDPRTGRRPYALVQLRQDDANGTIYN